MILMEVASAEHVKRNTAGAISWVLSLRVLLNMGRCLLEGGSDDMDHEDKLRTLSNKAKLLSELKKRGVITNNEARHIGGSRALGRVHELIKEGEPITVRKLKGAVWEVRYDAPALARSAETPVAYPDAHLGPLFDTQPGAYRS